MICPYCNHNIVGEPIQCPKCGKIIKNEGIKMIQREYFYVEKKGINAYKHMWKNSIEFLNRTTRVEFFHAILIQALIILILQFALFPAFGLMSNWIESPGLLSTFKFIKNTFYIVSFIPVFSLALRRLRDAGINPIFGFSILTFIFTLGFLSIIISNLLPIGSSITNIIKNPFPYLPFIFQNNERLQTFALIIEFLRFFVALTSVLLYINLLFILVASFLPTKKIS